jgi:hypothetical protein
MSLESLVAALTGAGFNVNLHNAPIGTVCPYLVIQDLDHPNYFADNKTFGKTTGLTLRLVESEVHDWDLLDTLEQTLDGLGLPFYSEDSSIPSEHVCESYYYINFYGGNKNG